MHVIQQRIVSDGMYKPGGVVPVCTIGVSCFERSWKAKKSWKGWASNMEVGALRGQGWAIPEKTKLSKSTSSVKQYAGPSPILEVSWKLSIFKEQRVEP